LLSKALEEGKHVAIAKLAMHNREYTVFLRPYSKGLMLHTMYYQDEIREVENFGETDVEIKESELKVAHQLVQALEADWEPKKYYDTFEANLKELIKAHLEGKQVNSIEKPKKAAPVVDLMEALKASLAQMEGQKKGPQRAIEAQDESRVHVINEGEASSRKTVKKRARA
jgi:DNA end-binding protein Ku